MQPSRRPKDGRYGENPNRLQHYYQFQVILKPSPADIQELYLKSLDAIGIDPSCTTSASSRTTGKARRSAPGASAGSAGATAWRSPSSPTSSRSRGFDCAPVSGELTYGLERLAMYVQGVDNVYDLNFNGRDDDKVTYGDVFLQAEQEYSRYNFEFADTEMLFEHFEMAEAACRISRRRLDTERQRPTRRHLMALPAYDQCIKASHVFNLLDARGVISVTERQSYILRVRELAKACGDAWLRPGGRRRMIEKLQTFGSHATADPEKLQTFRIRSWRPRNRLQRNRDCSEGFPLHGLFDRRRRLRAGGLRLAHEHHVALDQILGLRRSGLLRRQIADVQQRGHLQPRDCAA